MELTEIEFEELVAEAVRLIPEDFHSFMDNVQFLIEEEPGEDLLRDLGIPRNTTLLGLYSGTPLIKRPFDFTGFPDRITIFRRPLMERVRDRDGLRMEVMRTVLHEVGHHFGIGEERLAELGY